MARHDAPTLDHDHAHAEAHAAHGVASDPDGVDGAIDADDGNGVLVDLRSHVANTTKAHMSNLDLSDLRSYVANTTSAYMRDLAMRVTSAMMRIPSVHRCGVNVYDEGGISVHTNADVFTLDGHNDTEIVVMAVGGDPERIKDAITPISDGCGVVVAIWPAPLMWRIGRWVRRGWKRLRNALWLGRQMVVDWRDG